MTKRREPLTYHLALTRAAAVIGWDRLAALCGASPAQRRMARQEIEEAIAVMTKSLASLGKDPSDG